MTRMHKDIERLIVEYLDGELGEDEQLELNRRLIRDPEARRMMDDYRQIDALAVDAMRQVLGEGNATFNPATLTPPPGPRRSFHIRRGWWLVPGTIAAAILALVIPRPVMEPTEPRTHTVAGRAGLPLSVAEQGRRFSEQPLEMQPVGYSPLPRVRRDTGREVIGVVGDDGNIYWIEVDRTQTIKRPPRRMDKAGVGGSI